MNLTRLLLVALIPVCIQSARGQGRFRFGLQAGAHLTWLRTVGSPAERTWERPGWQFGLTGEAHLGKRWGLQSRLVLADKGYFTSADTTLYRGTRDEVRIRTATTVRLQYLQTALLLVFAPQGPGARGWQLLAGPYAGLGVTGRRLYHEERDYAGGPLPGNQHRYGTQLLKFGNRGSSGGGFGFGPSYPGADYRRFDISLEAGVARRWPRLQLLATLALSTSQLLPGHLEQARQHQYYLRGTGLTATYFFPSAQIGSPPSPH